MSRLRLLLRSLPAALVVPLLVAGCAASPPAPAGPLNPAVPAAVGHPPAPLPVQPPVGTEPDAAGPAIDPPNPAAAGAEPDPPPVFDSPAAENPEAQGKGVKGVATYYAKRFNGRPTASGVPYDPNKLTAAHQSIPFGTQVKVVNLANGREVTVTVNDRCRKRTSPFIDLSRAAATRLGFLGKGTAKVRIIPLSSEGQ